MATVPITASARTGYTLTVIGVDRGDPIVCVDCIRCGVTIMEAAPATITSEPAWFPKALTMHERTHTSRDVLVHFTR